MNRLVLNFTYADTQIRTQTDGETTRSALKDILKDIRDVFGIKNSRDVFARLDDGEKDSVDLTDATGRRHTMDVVNEPGLYSLIPKQN